MAQDTLDYREARKLLSRLAEKYPPSPAGLRDLLHDPEWRAAYPTSRVLPGGLIALNVIDVLHATTE